MSRFLTFLLLAGIMLSPLGLHAEDAPTTAVNALQTTLGQSIESLSMATQEIHDGDRTASSAELADAVTNVATLTALASDANNVTALGKSAKQIQKSIAAYGVKLSKAVQLNGDAVQKSATIQKAVGTAFRSAATVTKAVLKVKPAGPIVILEEKNAKTAGFHKPGDKVIFIVHCLGTATDPVQINIVSSTSGVIASSSAVQVNPNGTFTVVMGSQRGSAAVTVTWQGQTSTRLLYNSGEESTSPLPAAGKGKLVLSYSVSYQGATVTGVLTFTQTAAAAGFTPSIPGMYHLDSDTGNLITSFAAADAFLDASVGQDKTSGAYILTRGSGPQIELTFKVDADGKLVGCAIVGGGIEVVTYIWAANDNIYDGNVTTGTFSK